jgi:hypothetical protein
MKIKHIALGVVVLGVGISLNANLDASLIYLARPLAAVAFVIFMVCTLLGKEVQILSEQEHDKLMVSKGFLEYAPGTSSARGERQPTRAFRTPKLARN